MKHIIIIVILISMVILLTGCATHSTLTPPPQYTSPSVSPTSQSVVPSLTPTQSQIPNFRSLNAMALLAPVIAAMKNVTSVNIASNVIKQNTIPSQQIINSFEIWDSQRAVDISNNQMHLTLNIDNYGRAFSVGTKTDAYYDKDDLYLHTYQFAQLSLTPDWGWSKSKLGQGPFDLTGEELLPAKNQLLPIIELMESANQTVYLSLVNLFGVNYQIISFNPSAEAVGDWVLAQEFPGGPNLSISTGPSLFLGRGFMDSFQGGTFSIWVDTGSNLIVKAYFSPVFQAALNNVVYGIGIIGQLNFSGYNQPVNIQIPPEALNTTRRRN